MMNRMKSAPESVEMAIRQVAGIVERSTFKMVTSGNGKLRALHEARAKRARNTLYALLALQDKQRAMNIFYAARDSQSVIACLLNLERAERTFRKAVSVHAEICTPDIFII